MIDFSFEAIVYLNALLASLNARATLREQRGGVATIPLSGIAQFSSSTGKAIDVSTDRRNWDPI
jgi:hypothetical protein